MSDSFNIITTDQFSLVVIKILVPFTVLWCWVGWLFQFKDKRCQGILMITLELETVESLRLVMLIIALAVFLLCFLLHTIEYL